MKEADQALGVRGRRQGHRLLTRLLQMLEAIPPRTTEPAKVQFSTSLNAAAVRLDRLQESLQVIKQ